MLNDIGILEDSVRYYHDADAFTAAYLYSVPHAGVYHCNAQYEVERTPEDVLEVCQVMQVDEGELRVEYRGETLLAPAGAIVLLDCREPHRYLSTGTNLRMRWFHFVGCSSFAYTGLILNTHGAVLRVSQNAQIEDSFCAAMRSVQQNQPDPHLLSVTLHQFLSQLVVLLDAPDKSAIEQAIGDSAAYIAAHYADAGLTIAHLARRAALSTCYYVRKFKEYQAATPHAFLQAARLRAAKEQLTTTSRSIEEIADGCGFCNPSHFISVFRRSTGLTPLQFRVRWK